MRKIIIAFVLILLSCISVRGQFYRGIEGLVHSPSAEMRQKASLRVGGFYASGDFLPKTDYGTGYAPTFFVSLTPYEWIEASYMISVWNKDGYPLQDRSLSLRIRPLKEGKWWPSIVLGTQDPVGESVYTKNYSNAYIAASKHIDVPGVEIGLHAAYRHYFSPKNARWNGIVGGVTIRPEFYKPLRLIAEWNGCEAILGAETELFDFLNLQLALEDFRRLNFGIMLEIKQL